MGPQEFCSIVSYRKRRELWHEMRLNSACSDAYRDQKSLAIGKGIQTYGKLVYTMGRSVEKRDRTVPLLEKNRGFRRIR